MAFKPENSGRPNSDILCAIFLHWIQNTGLLTGIQGAWRLLSQCKWSRGKLLRKKSTRSKDFRVFLKFLGIFGIFEVRDFWDFFAFLGFLAFYRDFWGFLEIFAFLGFLKELCELFRVINPSHYDDEYPRNELRFDLPNNNFWIFWYKKFFPSFDLQNF